MGGLVRWIRDTLDFIQLWGLGWVCWEGVGDGGPGLGCRGREASLVQPRVSVMTWQTGEGFSLEGVSTTSF